MTDAELATALGPAVFRVEASGCDVTSIGTAFAIDANHLVTNRHVVQVDTTPQVFSRDGVRMQGKVIGWEEDPDIAVIEVTGDLETHLPWTPTSELSEGERLVVLGYPQPNHGFTVSGGSILSFVTENATSVAVEIDAAVDYGSSGSPALTAEGLVAGVVTAVDPNPGGLRTIPLMLPADQVRGIVDHIVATETTVKPDCGEPEKPSVANEIAETLASCTSTCRVEMPTLSGETPPFPEQIAGYRTNGIIYNEEVRVFDEHLSAPWTFEWAGHGCSSVWVARWRALSKPALTGVVVDPYYGVPGTYYGYYWAEPGSDPVAWRDLEPDGDPPRASGSGLLAGNICEVPAWFLPEDAPWMVDIVVDWMYWEPAP